MSNGGQEMDAVQLEAVVLFSGLKQHIRNHAHRENDKGGYEAVGFLAGKIGQQEVSTAVQLHNRSDNPTEAYFVEPWEQFKASRSLELAGYEVRGTYHSHTAGEARPSRTDQVMARSGELLLIYSVPHDELTGWIEREGSLLPVELVFVDPQE